MSFVMMALAAAVSAVVVVQEAAPIALPDPARDALNDKWRNWAPADLSGSSSSCLTDGAGPTSLVSADFDSDGHLDYALTVRTGDGVRLAAVLHRVPEYVVFDLEALDAAPAASLALAPRASRFTPASGIDDFYPADTILVRRCGPPDVAYIWTGFSFRKTPLAGGTDPAPLAH